MLNFCLLTPKRHILARNRVVWRIMRENRFRRLGCSSLEVPGRKKRSRVDIWCAISRIRGKEAPGGIATKFCMSVDIHDVITCATFYDDRLRGLGVAWGRIFSFPIDLRRWPYNTRTTVRVCEDILCRTAISEIPTVKSRILGKSHIVAIIQATRSDECNKVKFLKLKLNFTPQRMNTLHEQSTRKCLLTTESGFSWLQNNETIA